MKLRVLLVAALFMVMFAIASVSSVSATPGVVFATKAGLTTQGFYPFVHGVADYKVRADGGRCQGRSNMGSFGILVIPAGSSHCQQP